MNDKLPNRSGAALQPPRTSPMRSGRHAAGSTLIMALVAVVSACGAEDWSQKPLSETVNASTNLKIDYSLKLPAGLEPGVQEGTWKKGRELRISVGHTFLSVLDLDAAQREALEDPTASNAPNVVKKEVQGDRFVLWGHDEDKERAWVASYLPTDNQTDLACHVGIDGDDPLPKLDQLFTWMDSICASVTLGKPVAREPLPAALGEFISQLDGKAEHVAAVIKKFADPGMVSNGDLGIYDLNEPRLHYETKREGLRCFAMSAAAGATRRKFQVCFNDKEQIAVIADEGIDS